MLPGFKLNLSGSGVFFCGRPRRPYQPRPTRPLRLCRHPWTGLSYRPAPGQFLPKLRSSVGGTPPLRQWEAMQRRQEQEEKRRRRSKRLMTSGNGTRLTQD